MDICLPSLPTGTSFSEENSVGREFGASQSSSLGKVKHGFLFSCHFFSSSHPSSHGQGSSVSASITQATSQSRDILLICLAAINITWKNQAFLDQLPDESIQQKKSSTNNLYDYRWKSWLDWCIRQVDPFNPSIN